MLSAKANGLTSGLPVFVIPGRPRGQGSLQLWRAGDGTERAKHAPPTVEHRNLMVAMMRDAWGKRDPLNQPVSVRCEFTFGRPKSHYGTGKNANVLKGNAPKWCASGVDVDKLCRLCLDAGTVAGVWADDVLVVSLVATKVYGSMGSTTIWLGV